MRVMDIVGNEVRQPARKILISFLILLQRSINDVQLALAGRFIGGIRGPVPGDFLRRNGPARAAHAYPQQDQADKLHSAARGTPAAKKRMPSDKTFIRLF